MYPQIAAQTINKAAPSDKPRLVAHMDRLGSILGACHSLTAELEGVANRLLGEVPQAEGKSCPVPPAATHEQVLSEHVTTTDVLRNRLAQVLQRLNSAL